MPLYIHRVRIWSGGPSNKLIRSSVWTDRHLKTGMLRTNGCQLCNDHILLTESNDGSNLRSSWWYSRLCTHWAASLPLHPSLIKTLTFLIDLGIFEFFWPTQCLMLLIPLFRSSCRGEGPRRKGVQEFSLFPVEQPFEVQLWHGSTEHHSSLHCYIQGLRVISSGCGSIGDPSCFPQITLHHHLSHTLRQGLLSDLVSRSRRNWFWTRNGSSKSY